MTPPSPEPVAPDRAAAPPDAAGPIAPRGTALRDWIRREAEPEVSACFQCRKCSGGCPIAPWMDILPHQVLRMVDWGLEDELLASKTVWLCSACKTCVTRCPNGIDIARILEALRRRARREGVEPAEANVADFMAAFLQTVRRKGRLHELSAMRRYKLQGMARGRPLFADAALGLRMMVRGKLRLFGPSVRGIGDIRRLFEASDAGTTPPESGPADPGRTPAAPRPPE